VKRQLHGAVFAAAPSLISSANLLIENLGADMTVNDASGEINPRNVTGSFTVESDGSGSIYATDIRGSVIVQDDGSGEER
jgi:hypothetical protein